MDRQVPPAVATARSQQMAALGRRLAQRFHAQLVGQEVEVLFESVGAGAAPLWEGLTDTYVRVRAAADDDLANKLRLVRITAADSIGVTGELA